MKILHIGQMIGGLDVYIRNSIQFASGDLDYVIMHGMDDYKTPVYCKGKEVKEYSSSLQRNLNPWKDVQTLYQAIRNRYSGRLLDLNVDEFIDAICELLEKPQLLEEYGRNARKLYEDEFDIRKRIGMLEDVYRQVAKK